MKRSPLKKMGTDKARETRKYWPLRRKFMMYAAFCEMPDCYNRSESIHHMKGQNWRVMNDTKFWMALCRDCHRYIEDHKNEARKKGWILYK